MSTDAPTGPALVPRTFHRAGRRRASSPTFSERRRVTSTVLTVLWLVVLSTLVGVAIGKGLAMVVHMVLGLVSSLAMP